MLKEAIEACSLRRSVRLIRVVYEQGLTLEEAARELSVHVNTVQRRHLSTLRRLRACFVNEGVAVAGSGR